VTKCEILRRLLRLRMTRALPKQIALGFPPHRVIPSERLDQRSYVEMPSHRDGLQYFSGNETLGPSNLVAIDILLIVSSPGH
jgi:hypothetical protein